MLITSASLCYRYQILVYHRKTQTVKEHYTVFILQVSPRHNKSEGNFWNVIIEITIIFTDSREQRI